MSSSTHSNPEGEAENWEVQLSPKAEKENKRISLLAKDLLKKLKTHGPIRKDWKNFGVLHDRSYHCHIKKGRPTYVACWRVLDKEKKIIKVFYIGTHENAPY